MNPKNKNMATDSRPGKLPERCVQPPESQAPPDAPMERREKKGHWAGVWAEMWGPPVMFVGFKKPMNTIENYNSW